MKRKKKKRKKFSKSLFELYDVKGREWFKEKLPKKYEAEDNKKLDVDLSVFEGLDYICDVEVEVRPTLWTPEGQIKYDTIHIPSRKEKFFKSEYPTLFVAFNDDGRCCWACLDNVILKCPMKEVHNVYVSHGEYFFDVPVENGIENDIEKAINQIRGGQIS